MVVSNVVKCGLVAGAPRAQCGAPLWRAQKNEARALRTVVAGVYCQHQVPVVLVIPRTEWTTAKTSALRWRVQELMHGESRTVVCQV